jgi:hypothetical protein
LHSLFLDRFGTEFLTWILDFLNTTEIIENFQLRPNNIQEWILWIEGVSSNFDENAFAKLIQVINIGFFWNDSTVKLEISEENNKNINFIKNGEFLTEDTEKVLIIKNKLGDNPIRSFKYNLEGYKKEEMS